MVERKILVAQTGKSESIRLSSMQGEDISVSRIINAVLLAGMFGTIIGTIGIRMAHEPSLIRIFDNLHWTSSTATAAIIAWLVFMRASPADNKGLFWIALGLSGYAVGQILWDIQSAVGYAGFPAPSDLFYLCLGPLVTIGLVREIRSYTTQSQRKTIWLDTVTLVVALLTLVLTLYLPKRGDTTLLSMLVLIAYPTTLLAAAITALTMVPALRLHLSWSLLLFIAGLAATGMSWMNWNFLALDGIAIDGSWFNASFSAAVLLIAVALARWKIEINKDSNWDRRCEAVLRLLPLLTVVIVSVAVVLSHTLANLPYAVHVIADAGAIIVVLLAMIRQGTLMKDRDELLSVQATLIDSQNDLVQERGRLKTLVSVIPDLVWLKDEKGIYLSCNKMFEKLYGHSEGDIIGKTDYDFVSRELADFFRQHDQAAIEANGSRTNEEWLTFADGDYQGQFETIKTPMYDESHNLIGVLGIARDITERVQVQNELLKLFQAVQQVGEAIMMTDRNGIIEYVNPAFSDITGYAPEDALGKTPAMLKSSAQDPSFYKNLWDTITRGEVWHGTLIDRKKDGSFYPAMMSVAPIHNDSGDITHFVSLQQDMTEYKAMEEQFLQAQKMEAIGTLVGGIAHDFNNMLAAIQGNVFLSRAKLKDQPDVVEKLDSIEMLGMRAADMVKQLLTFARKDRVQMRPFSLNAFIKEAFKLAKTAIPENIELLCDTCQEELTVSGDATQLQQVLMNLLNNARDAVAHVSQPRIFCSLKLFVVTAAFTKAHPDTKGEQFAQLVVRDNGAGISKEHLDKVFEPFFTTKGVGEGTGLGLAMVYGAVQSHGGIIDIDSSPGMGTTFSIYLPLSKPDETTEADTSIITEGKGETILLVDDEESMRDTTAEVLKSLGYQVLTAEDGVEALALFKAHPQNIALLLTDIVMPKMGGVELAESIRQLAKDVPIIFATGYDKDSAIYSGDQVAQSTVINKPFSFTELSHLLRQMMGAD